MIFKAQTPQKITGKLWPYINFSDIPILPVVEPVTIELAFRYKGKGVKKISFEVKESRDPKTGKRRYKRYKYNAPHSATEMVNSGWIKGKLQIPSSSMRNISFWDMGIDLAPDAKVTLEIDYIKVFANP